MAKSSLNYPFICHVSDSNGEMPFYNREMGQAELVLMAAWCEQFENPFVLDVGGNVGFIATQLAQLLLYKKPRIFSFEPVSHTLTLLAKSVQGLRLEDFVFPVGCGLGEAPGFAQLSYSKWDTMFAQISANGKLNKRVGDKLCWGPVLTIDQITDDIGAAPCLIKLDIEGYEVKALKGAARVLSSESPPAIAFELNPTTLSELGSSVDELVALLRRYQLYYVSDFENQRLDFGAPISDGAKLDWVCNLFAVPKTAGSDQRWVETLERARSHLASLSKKDQSRSNGTDNGSIGT